MSVISSTLTMRVSSAVLIGPVKAFAPAGVSALTARAASVREGGMTSVASAIAAGGISRKTSTSRPLSKSAVFASLISSPAEGYALACLAGAKAVDPDYSTIRAPTLIVAGDEDKTCPKATVEFLQKSIAGAKVVELKDVGHWHQLEDCEALAKELAVFM
jgi:pimeloyl-ACP methyl ester carboxylesterase